MRVRLYPLGDGSIGEVIRLDHFPVTLMEEPGGTVIIGEFDQGIPLCVLDVEEGNLIIVSRIVNEETTINEDPVERGGISPGEILGVGERRFLVSYERTTSHPLPCRRYRILSTQPT